MNLSFLNTLDLEHGGNLIIMVGPPCSGKTTVANQICKECDNFVIISPDKIREEFFDNSYNKAQNEIVFGKVYSQLTSYLEDGKNIIYDAINCRSTYRYKIIDACKQHAYKVICLMSTTPISECIRRNNKQKKQIPEEAIERMYFNLRKHPPIIFEGYDLIARF